MDSRQADCAVGPHEIQRWLAKVARRYIFPESVVSEMLDALHARKANGGSRAEVVKVTKPLVTPVGQYSTP